MNEEKDREETAVEETVLLENEAIETDSTAEPETSADAAENAEADQGCNEDESPEPKKPNRKKAAIVAAAACLAIAVGGVAVMSANHTAQPVAKEQKAKASKKSKEDVETAEATIRVTAEGLTSDSSAVITHWTGDGEGTRGTEFYHATTAEAAPQGTDRVEVAVGSWKVEVLPSVNADGSINEGTAEAVEVEVRADETSTVDRGVTTTPADQVTQDRLNEVLDEVNAAVSKGDKTLTGDAGTEVVNKATDNASKNPNADAAQIEQKREEGTGAAQEAKPQETAPAKQDTSSGSSSGSSSKTDTGKQQSSQKSDSNKGSSSSSSGSSSSAKAECSHNWVAVTHQEPVYSEQPVYETRTRTVVDQEAWTEWVNGREYILVKVNGGNPAKFYDEASADAYEKQQTLAGNSVSYSVEVEKTQVNHPAVTHEESYQVQTGTKQVQTGTKTVTDGYRCSKCGATK